jgi:hypothetical protein
MMTATPQLVARDLLTGTRYERLSDLPDDVLVTNQLRIVANMRQGQLSVPMDTALDCYNQWQYERDRRRDLAFLREAVNA